MSTDTPLTSYSIQLDVSHIRTFLLEQSHDFLQLYLTMQCWIASRVDEGLRGIDEQVRKPSPSNRQPPEPPHKWRAPDRPPSGRPLKRGRLDFGPGGGGGVRDDGDMHDNSIIFAEDDEAYDDFDDEESDAYEGTWRRWQEERCVMPRSGPLAAKVIAGMDTMDCRTRVEE